MRDPESIEQMGNQRSCLDRLSRPSARRSFGRFSPWQWHYDTVSMGPEFLIRAFHIKLHELAGFGNLWLGCILFWLLTRSKSLKDRLL